MVAEAVTAPPANAQPPETPAETLVKSQPARDRDPLAKTPPPDPVLLAVSVKVVSDTSAEAPAQTAPPSAAAVTAEKVVWLTVALPAAATAPPEEVREDAWLTVQLLRVASEDE